MRSSRQDKIDEFVKAIAWTRDKGDFLVDAVTQIIRDKYADRRNITPTDDWEILYGQDTGDEQREVDAVVKMSIPDRVKTVLMHAGKDYEYVGECLIDDARAFK
jgi:hypothetical protein